MSECLRYTFLIIHHESMNKYGFEISRLPYFGFVLFSESDSEDNLEKSVNNNDDDNGEFIHLFYMKIFYQ